MYLGLTSAAVYFLMEVDMDAAIKPVLRQRHPHQLKEENSTSPYSGVRVTALLSPYARNWTSRRLATSYVVRTLTWTLPSIRTTGAGGACTPLGG